MSSYIETIEQTPDEGKWALVRQWMQDDPLPLYQELRAYRPILVLPELTLVTRHSDCQTVLLQHDLFSVEPYVSKQGDFFMAQDDTARHWREKSVMKSLLDFEALPTIRQFVQERATAILARAGGEIEAVRHLTREVPASLVEEIFGFADCDHSDLIRWSYWNQMDAFWNPSFNVPFIANSQEIIANREASKGEMVAYLQKLAARRIGEIKAGKPGSDPFTRLLLLQLSKALLMEPDQVGLNIGGLVIATIETTSHASVNAISQLFGDPARLEAARKAAREDDPDALRGYVFEALRYQPAFPYFFRRCERESWLGLGSDYATQIAPGTMVVAVTHSAMFDEHAFHSPESFDPGRSLRSMFHFGLGLHECLGRAIGAVMVTEIVRAALLLDGLQFEPADRKGGPVPESWPWRYRA